MKKKIVLATRNKDKVKEIKHLFEILNFKDVDFLMTSDFPNIPEVEEDEDTLKKNAIKKATVIGNYTGFPSLAEDTGLFVDYLNGAPGVYSARYADKDPKKHTATYKDNYEKLLSELNGVPQERRTAEFVCVAAFYIPKKNKCFTRKGAVKGFITDRPIGNNGFGYDPVFYIPEKQKTFAQMLSEEKNCISHRFLAIKKIISVVKKELK